MHLGGSGFYWRSMNDLAKPNHNELRRGDQGVRTFGLPGYSLKGEQSDF